MIAIALGIVAGLISGLLPAAGNLTTMLLFWPLLTNLNVYELVLFYMSMASISQYVSSIPAILFGIPGESSSIPAVHESKKLSAAGKLSALKGCATGSFIGTVVTFLIIYALHSDIQSITAKFYNSYTVFALLTFSILVTAAVSSGTFFFNLFLTVLGGSLAYIGYNQFFDTTVTFGLDFLAAGLPDIVVITVLFGVPEIYQSLKYSNATNAAYTTDKVIDRFLEFPKAMTSAIATLVGAIGGLVPGLTTVASSSISYAIGKLKNEKPKELIYYSETANNAGSVSQMLPLLLFGIPIIGSEALLLTMMTQKGYSTMSMGIGDILSNIWIGFIMVNIVGVVIAFTAAYYGKISINVKYISVAVATLLAMTVLYTGYTNHALVTYISTALFLAPIAYMLRNANTVCLILGYLTLDKLLESCYRIYTIF